MSLPFEPRDEDRRLLTGAGRFCDDERAAGEAHAVFVRSPHAFAAIRGIDTTRGAALPGVLAVLTAADMEQAGIGNVTLASPVPNGAGLVVPHRPALAGDCVRHVGEAVALVVAESEAIARDAAELVAVDYEPRDPVTDVAAAVASGGAAALARGAGQYRARLARVWRRPSAPSCRCAIFAGAAHVARVRLVNQRIVMAPMEPRGALARYDARERPIHSVLRLAERLCAAAESGAVHGAAAGAHARPERRCRRRLRHARRPAIRNTRRCWSRRSGPAAPVRWLASRSEGFLTDNQARDTIIEAALALGRRRAVSRARHRRARQYGRLPDLARGLYRDRQLRALPARACTTSRRSGCASAAFSPTPCRPDPIAAPAAPRRITARTAGRCGGAGHRASTGSNCAGAT